MKVQAFLHGIKFRRVVHTFRKYRILHASTAHFTFYFNKFHDKYGLLNTVIKAVRRYTLHTLYKVRLLKIQLLLITKSGIS